MLNWYETDVLNACRRWKAETVKPEGRDFPDRKGAPLAPETVRRLMDFLSDPAFLKERLEAVLECFRREGLEAQSLTDIRKLSLKEVDKVAESFSVSQRLHTFILWPRTGLPAGAASAAESAVSQAAWYAGCYGFDLSEEHERLYLMRLLALGLAPARRKAAVLKSLNRLARQIARGTPPKSTGESSVSRVISRMAEIGPACLALWKRFRAWCVPDFIFFPLPGTCFPVGITERFIRLDVGDAARHLYRERFLAEQDGNPSLIQDWDQGEDGRAGH